MEKLEIIVETVEDALAAERGGATQLDLKSHYPCSGVTPSAGAIERVLASVSIPVMVMIRPHARSFVPSKDDTKTACAEVRQAKKIGAVNFLTGFLSADHKLNKDALKAIRDAAGECNLHSHLAWELTDNPEKAIEVLIALGFKSLRTGGKSAGSDAFGGNVANATNNIIKIKNFANNRIEILLAGGITIDNVQDIILRTGITDIHCGRGTRTPADAQSPVDQEKVNAIREAQLNAIGALNKKLKI